MPFCIIDFVNIGSGNALLSDGNNLIIIVTIKQALWH